jgi:hypothetical protein
MYLAKKFCATITINKEGERWSWLREKKNYAKIKVK